LYRFAFSLAKSETTACDLTQQAFYLWAAKGHGLRDRTKVKSWLFTTLYREFLNARRHEVRFPHVELDGDEPTTETPATFSALDGATVLDALREIDEVFRAPLTLFYLEDFSYREIADVLEIPCGTVMSRLSRGKAQLRRALADRARETEQKIVQMPTLPQKAK
jgi:RNA polymerase sigma-70 factor (ECF subfamily)